jgi:plastocyanin
MSRRRIARTARILALAGALSLMATACGGGSSGGTSGGGGGGTPVDVTLKDFSINVGTTSFTPGKYTFHVSNQGPSSHNLTINGPGVDSQGTPTFASGGSQDLTVTLQQGIYELFCSVPGHKQAGMDTSITVGG